MPFSTSGYKCRTRQKMQSKSARPTSALLVASVSESQRVCVHKQSRALLMPLALASPAVELAAAADSMRWAAVALLVSAFAVCFAFFAPLAYGFPLDDVEFEARMWLASWRTPRNQ